MLENVPTFQRRLIAWQRRHGTKRLVAVVTMLAVGGSGLIAYLTIILFYGFGDRLDEVPKTLWILPFVIPAVIAPLMISQLATTIATTSQLVEDLSVARAKLEHEVRARQQAQLELENLARRDPLTGLLNRRGFFDALAQLPPGQHERLLIATADVDRFKSVNDTFGHGAGDRVLQAVAQRFSTAAGRDAIVARLGGDEFTAAIFDEKAIEKIRRALGSFDLDQGNGADLRVQCSIGVARHTIDADIDSTLAIADGELYQDKDRHHIST